jgi:predicted metalloprotease with PDZ domain
MPNRFARRVAPALCWLLLVAAAPAAETVRYVVAPDLDAHEWRVEATFPHPVAGDVDFWLPRWTAGAYHLAEYGRFVRELAASGPDGAELPVARPDPCHFVVKAGAAAAVKLAYVARACAPRELNDGMILDVEGSRLTKEYGFLSPNSLLGFVPALQDDACEVELALPEGWKAATALEEKGPGKFAAPSWWRLEDTPILFSPTQVTLPFEVDGIPHSVTVYGQDAEQAQPMADECRKIVEAGRDYMQGLPYTHYHFLLAFVPESANGAAGLEHSESTLILMNPVIAGSDEFGHLVAHEYFHLWCAERIHVAALERPDYTAPIRTGTIWVNEGLTEYFSRLLLVRAGLSTREEFFDSLWREGASAGGLAAAVGDRSWTEVNRATADWHGMDDLMAFSIKNYQGACQTILALDLEMRRASNGARGVADLLRFLFRAYAMHHRGFGEDEVPAIVDGIAQADLSGFFAQYIDGPKLPDLKERLEYIGYTTRGGLKKIVPVKEPTAEQRRALERFFALPEAAK